MKKIYENSSCKVFPGFYDSLLYNSDTLHNFNNGNLPDGFCWEFVKGGYQEFVKETCEKWVSDMKENLEHSRYADKDNPLNVQIGKYRSMWSPREYNFMTNRIRFDVSFNLNELKKFCWKTNRDKFNDYLHKNWTSRDGFWSFVPNNVDKFEYEYFNKGERHKDMLIDIMLEWYFLEYIDFDDVLNDTLEEDYTRISSHITLQSEEDWSLWDFEYDDKTDSYIPTRKLETA